MEHRRARGWSRRQFVGGLTLAGTAGLLGVRLDSTSAEPPPETTRLRLLQFPTSICQAPLYRAEELLRAEGFTDIQYVRTQGGVLAQNLASGEVNIGMNFVGPNLIRIEAGDPVLILAGGHVGCFELFGGERVRAIRDLKGKAVAVAWLGGPEHVFLSSMAAYVGLDPRTDITWAVHPPAESMTRFAEGKLDAFLAFPPTAQELRARKIGHMVVNSMMDRPWSQYFCCTVAAHREFVQRHPVATKRALRAILRSIDASALEPERAARFLVDRGYAQSYEYTLQTLKDIPYGKWREYDPEDTVRFYALRLHEAGMLKSSPKKLIAEAADWRFLRELRTELKG